MKFTFHTILVSLSLVGLLAADPAEDIESGINIEEVENSLMKALEQRDPKKELQENVDRKKLVFYCTGSYLYGYEVPGLSQAEVDEFINSKAYEIENHYQTDPMPVFQPDGYEEKILVFMETYNKLLLKHIKTSLATPVENEV